MEKTKTNANSNFGRKGWLLIILSLVGCFIGTSASGSINVGATHFIEVMGCTQTQLMLATTFGQLFGAAMGALGGKMLVKHSPRRIIMICAIVYAVCFILNGRCTALWQFYITFVCFMAFSWIWAFMCVSALIANWFPRKRGIAMGWVTMGMPLGSGIAALLMSAIASNVGFYASYYPYAVLAIVVAILCNVCLKDFPSECGCYPDNDKNFDMAQLEAEEAALREMREKSPWTPKRIFATKEFWFISLSISLMMFASGFMGQVVPTLLTFGISESVAPMFMMAICLFACVGSFLLGMVDTKFGSKKAILITFCMVIAMGFIEQLNFLPTKLFGFVLLGLVMGAGSNFLLSIIMHCWGKESCMGVFRFAQPIMSAIASFGSTVIAAIATAAGGNYNASFLVISLMSIVGLVLIIFVRDGFVEKKEAKFLAKSK